MGLILGIGNRIGRRSVGANVNQIPDEWYGVEWLTTETSPDVTRIAENTTAMALHASLPFQSNMKTALLLDSGAVNYYLKADDWTKKEDGTASDLTGADGQVMTKIPAGYWQFVEAGNLRQVKYCNGVKTGFTFYPEMWVGSYEAALNRTNNKLASVASTSTDYRGGNNNAAWDAAVNTLLGRPATNISRTAFRTYARNRGTGWEMYMYNAHKLMFWGFVIEYATRNSQKPVNAALTAEGYRQGGLGNGVTDAVSAEWSAFSSYNPFIGCGDSNSLGNSSGEVSKTITDFGGSGVNRAFTVPRYRGIENPFGHIWKNCDGINIKIQAVADGNESQVWTADNPSDWNDSNYTNYENKGLLSRANGYMSEALFGANGEFVPKVAAGSSTTYFCDYFNTLIPGSGADLRTLLVGGVASYGSAAGFGYSLSHNSPAYTSAALGSRLCYIAQ